jgi:hypothetical protein
MYTPLLQGMMTSGDLVPEWSYTVWVYPDGVESKPFNVRLIGFQFRQGQNGGSEAGTDPKHPTEVKRPEGGGYGYTGVSQVINGKTYYRMSDKLGKLFWVDKDWNLLEKPSMLSYLPGGENFWETHMGQDIQRVFPILKKESGREILGHTGQGIFEYFLEKAISWPFPLPIFIPHDHKFEP